VVTAGGTTMSSPQMTDKFYRLYGDVSGYEGGTGVARVTTTDSTPFGPAFLETTGVLGYNAGFDFDGDGRIQHLRFRPLRPPLPQHLEPLRQRLRAVDLMKSAVLSELKKDPSVATQAAATDVS
jgi:hypothetical protein